jgi:hypothetical protein
MNYAIKLRKVGAKRFAFVSANGMNYLRVHAVRYATFARAQQAIDASGPNEGWQFKIVELGVLP